MSCLVRSSARVSSSRRRRVPPKASTSAPAAPAAAALASARPVHDRLAAGIALSCPSLVSHYLCARACATTTRPPYLYLSACAWMHPLTLSPPLCLSSLPSHTHTHTRFDVLLPLQSLVAQTAHLSVVLFPLSLSLRLDISFLSSPSSVALLRAHTHTHTFSGRAGYN